MSDKPTLVRQIEAVLFISPRPLTKLKLVALLESDKEAIAQAIKELKADYASRDGGLAVLEHENEVQLVTSANVATLVRKFLKEELTGELTRPSLETLTIIAYRGPITKSDLEKIRGVNCSIILRNLMIRGLVQAEEDKKRLMTYYTVSTDFVRHLGLTAIKDLPQYDELHDPEVVERLLNEGMTDGQ